MSFLPCCSVLAISPNDNLKHSQLSHMRKILCGCYRKETIQSKSHKATEEASSFLEGPRCAGGGRQRTKSLCLCLLPQQTGRGRGHLTLSTNGIHRHVCVGVSNPKSSVKSEMAGQNGVENRLQSQHRPLRVLFASRLRQRIGLTLPDRSWTQGKVGFLGGRGWCCVSGC